MPSDTALQRDKDELPCFFTRKNHASQPLPLISDARRLQEP
jgi:hypothetical protein